MGTQHLALGTRTYDETRLKDSLYGLADAGVVTGFMKMPRPRQGYSRLRPKWIVSTARAGHGQVYEFVTLAELAAFVFGMEAAIAAQATVAAAREAEREARKLADQLLAGA